MKINLVKYDVNCTEAPFKSVMVKPCIDIYQDDVNYIVNDESGTACSIVFSRIANQHGERFKFFTTSSDPGIDFDVFVYGEFEEEEFNKILGVVE